MPQPAGQKLTKRVVEGTAPDPVREIFLWDSQLAGFGVRIYPSGRRVYLVQYRSHGGRQRRAMLGPHGPLTTEQARERAAALLADVHKGEDPAGNARAHRKAPTVAELCDRYLADHARQHKKPRSIAEDERMIASFIKPALGPLKVTAIGRPDIIRAHRELRNTPTQANRCLALLSKMMSLAERWGLRPDGSNPCRHVDKNKERSRNRFLAEDELARLAEVLAAVERERAELPGVAAAVRLLLFTGARLSEILTLRWDHVDLPDHCLRLADSKTGAKTIYLPPAAMEVLAELPRVDGNPFVIVGGKPGAHLVDLERPWRRIRARAGLDDVRLHDLRHSFASMAVAGGLSLPMIGALLGHRQTQTTARYAHLAADPLKQAVHLTGSRIAAAMKVATTKKVKENGEA